MVDSILQEWDKVATDLERGATAPGILIECRDVRASIAAYVRAGYERALTTTTSYASIGDNINWMPIDEKEEEELNDIE